MQGHSDGSQVGTADCRALRDAFFDFGPRSVGVFFLNSVVGGLTTPLAKGEYTLGNLKFE